MKTWTTTRVRVTKPDKEHAELKGKTGTVTRKLIRDESAWVSMDEPISEKLARFSKGDTRRNHVNLWPDECSPANG